MSEPVVSTRPATRPGRDWRRIARGLYLVGIGSALLMNTTGHLPWGYWLWLLDWWPMLLVMAGIRLVFDRSRLPALALLAPALALGTMALVAVRGGTQAEDAAPLGPVVRVARPAELPEWRLELETALADLEVIPGDGSDLARGQSSGRRSRLRLQPSASGRFVRARAGFPAGRWAVLPGRWRERVRLELAPEVPLAVEMRGAMSRIRGDLRRIPLRSLAVEGGFYDLDLRLGAPEGHVPLRFDGAFSTILLRVPADTRIDLRETGALNLVETTGREAPGEASYRIDVEGAFQGLDVVEE